MHSFRLIKQYFTVDLFQFSQKISLQYYYLLWFARDPLFEAPFHGADKFILIWPTIEASNERETI